MNAEPERSRFDIELGTTAVVVIAFLLLRLLAVARWDWPTVAAIADTFDFGDSFAIAFGTIAEQPWLTGIFTAILLPLVLLRLFWPLPHHRGTLQIAMILAAVLLSVTAFAMTITYRNPWTLLGAAGMGVVFALIRLGAAEGRLNGLSRLLADRVALIAAVGVLLLAAFDSSPWMVKEQITTTTQGTFDGYVLEEAPGFLHILTADREIVILPSGDVTQRRLLD
ncbi:hypothetical protein [Gordonia caeni]|uniref:LTA synthase family protein n=1 Tax=Gordonia caeni TaxID=1007097 RepID=A0ABP7P5T5_9ACTN